MSLILNIDTATETAGVYLADKGVLIASSVNQQQNDHAAWIHTAIEKLMKAAGHTMNELKAIAVTAGPGSYTGLRVGMATAKGLCYALKIPFITESTLKLLASSAIAFVRKHKLAQTNLYCPLIDARRMEVFTAVYNEQLEEIIKPNALILTENSFAERLSSGTICFFGSGSGKWQKISTHINARFEMVKIDGNEFALLSYKKFLCNEFTALAYAEPVYLKEFYTYPK